MKKRLSIEGMKCDGCAKTVREHLESIDGVTNASVSLADKGAVIESQNDVSDHAIRESLADVTYKVLEIKEA